MHQVKEFLDTKLRPPGGHNVELILGNKIGPVRWYGAPTASAVMEPGSVLTPVLRTREQIKLLAEQRVVRMRYPKGSGLNRRLRVQLTVSSNVFVERLWRSVKYERVYLKAYACVSDARPDIADYMEWFNTQRPHSRLDRITPNEKYLVTLPTLDIAA